MFALIKAGKVVAVIVADAPFVKSSGKVVAAAHGAPDGAWVELLPAHNVNGQRPGPGWKYAKGKFSPPVGA